MHSSPSALVSSGPKFPVICVDQFTRYFWFSQLRGPRESPGGLLTAGGCCPTLPRESPSPASGAGLHRAHQECTSNPDPKGTQGTKPNSQSPWSWPIAQQMPDVPPVCLRGRVLCSTYGKLIYRWWKGKHKERIWGRP